jgi:hypothetical protein
MAVTRLSNVIVPEYYAEYMAENSPVSLSLSQPKAGLLEHAADWAGELGFTP